ncbi:transposase, partial [bacterium]|nr:transposase [bacterium]
NDITGASAYDPRILLKVILMAYSRGVTSSRVIEKLCLENMIFMALSRDSRPHFTTIANFISKLPLEMADLFSDVLTLCGESDQEPRQDIKKRSTRKREDTSTQTTWNHRAGLREHNQQPWSKALHHEGKEESHCPMAGLLTGS